MVHPVLEYPAGQTFNLPVYKPVPVDPFLDALPKASILTYSVLRITKARIDPPTNHFGAWLVEERGPCWELYVWQIPSHSSLAMENDRLHDADAIELRPHGWLWLPADGTLAMVDYLWRLSEIAYRYDALCLPLVPKERRGFGYALNGSNHGRAWYTAESRGLSLFTARVNTRHMKPPYKSIEEAWDAGIGEIEEALAGEDVL